MKEVELLSAAWYGDKPITINFPSSWDVVVVGEKDIPALTDNQIRGKINNPIGSPQLSDLASKRNRAAIIIDDITRPTPTAKLIPFILEELKFAGINRGLNGIQITAWGEESPHWSMSSWPHLIPACKRMGSKTGYDFNKFRRPEKINDCNENREQEHIISSTNGLL